MESQPQYGYVKDPEDKNRWIVDEAAAKVVRRIFGMVIEGMGTWAIAEKLHADKVERPAYYLGVRGIGRHKNRYDKERPYSWSYTMVGQMLSKVEYLGHTVNFKTERLNFKSKKFNRRPREDWLVIENTHEPIVSRETFDAVQKLRETVRCPNKMGEANPLTGLLFCAACGAKMYNRRYRNTDTYECSTHKFGENKFDEMCTPHHVRSAAVGEIILDVLRRTSGFVREHEAEFVELVHAESALRHGETAKSDRKRIAKNERRIAELDKLIISVYEDKVKGILPEERFVAMAAAYELEQSDLKRQTAALQSALDAFNADSANAGMFVGLTRQFTRFDELTTVMLNEFVDKVIVHEGEWSEGVNPETKRGMGTRRQRVEVFLKYIGDMEVPDLRTPEEIEAELAAAEKTEQRLTRMRENRRRYVENSKARKE